MINFLVSSKPVDGLFYYSYEYCTLLNESGIDAQVIVICHRNFPKQEYIKSIEHKYLHCKNIVFDDYTPNKDDITMVMGRSQLTLSWQDFKDYNTVQQDTLKKVFKSKLISVYSENHPTKYPLAIEFYNPKQIVDLCDTEVYPNGVGDHFEKTINFSIYKPFENNVQFKYLFLGTNKEYYAASNLDVKTKPLLANFLLSSSLISLISKSIFVN